MLQFCFQVLIMPKIREKHAISFTASNLRKIVRKKTRKLSAQMPLWLTKDDPMLPENKPGHGNNVVISDAKSLLKRGHFIQKNLCVCWKIFKAAFNFTALVTEENQRHFEAHTDHCFEMGKGLWTVRRSCLWLWILEDGFW